MRVYTDYISCSIAIVDKNDKFKGFLNSTQFKKNIIYLENGNKIYDKDYNFKLRELSRIDLKKKIQEIKNKGYNTIGKIIMRS